MATKVCTKCNERKSLDSFCKNARSKDGLSQHCKSCNAAYQKEYRKTTTGKATIKKSTKKYRSKPEQIKKQAEYNKESLKRTGKTSTTVSRNWQKNNPGKHRIHKQADNNRRRLAKLQPESYTSAQFMELFKRVGKKCSYCKKSLTVMTVTADHIVPLSKGGSNRIDNIAPACMSCNLSKGASTDPKWKPFWRA